MYSQLTWNDLQPYLDGAAMYGALSLAMVGGTLLLLWFVMVRGLPRSLALLLLIILSKSLIATQVALWDGRGWLGLIVSPWLADWLFTTPLTVILLWQWTQTSLSRRRVRQAQASERRTLLGLLALDGGMLVCGMLAERTAGATRLFFFTLAALLFARLLIILWTRLARRAADRAPAVRHTYRWLASFVSAAWLVFPLLWLLGPYALAVLAPDEWLRLLAFANIAVKSLLFILFVGCLFHLVRAATDEQAPSEPAMKGGARI